MQMHNNLSACKDNASMVPDPCVKGKVRSKDNSHMATAFNRFFAFLPLELAEVPRPWPHSIHTDQISQIG